MEEAFINKKSIAKEILPFNFQYFGLGRTSTMKEKIKLDLQEHSIKGDIIVSTDLEIFQDNRIAKSLKNTFKHDSSLFPIRRELMDTFVLEPKGYFHPFIVIPLVILVNTQSLGENKPPKSLYDLLDPSFKLKYTFGGLHNSAGRSLLKALWYLYGVEAAEAFLANAVVTSMPAQAFQKVNKGEVMAAIVPTIFAKRAGINNLQSYWPEEGAIAIPSYVAVKNSISSEALDVFTNSIIGIEHQTQLRDFGDVIPVHQDVSLSISALENQCKLLYPSWDFFEGLDYEKFEALCEKYKYY